MKRRALMPLTLFWLVSLSLAIAAAPANRTITPEIVASMKLVTEVALSPDGQWIAYVVRSPRREGEKPGGYHYQLWLVDTEGKDPHPLTAREYNARSIHWFKDSKRIAFLSRRGKRTQQIYTIRIDGGEAQPLTSEKHSIANYAFSPDEQLIAFTRRDAPTPEEEENKKRGRDWRVVGQDFKYLRLYIHDLGTRETRLLTDENLHVTGFDWSPDGREVIFTASQTPLTDHTYMYQKIYRISAAGGRAEIVVPTEGKLGHVAYSPNGRRIAWLGAVDIHDPSAQNVFIARRDGQGKRNLTADYQGSVIWFHWLDDETIAMIGIEKTATRAYRLDVNTGRRELMLASRPVFSALSFDADHRAAAFAGSTPFHPSEVFYLAGGDEPRRLTNNNPILDELELADQFTIEYQADDGTTITGLVMKPVGYQEGRRYPLIVSVHGGPEAAVLDGWNTYYIRWGQLLAAHGYVVFWPNYRGSTGRGVAYSKKDQKDLGGAEFRDVLAGIAYLADELGLVDKSRVGMGGGSYGGYFSALAATRYSEHFTAAIDFAGITNWVSFLGTSDIPMENTLVHWGFERPYDHLEEMWNASPMKYIKQSKTALLIAHGAEDERVPIGQAWEIYTALRILDQTPYEFVIYPREGHGLAEREHQIDFMKRVLRWFDTYVKGASR